MTWMIVVIILVSPLVIFGCEETFQLQNPIQSSLKKTGDLWTATVRVEGDNSHEWQLGLRVEVNIDSNRIQIMNLTLKYEGKLIEVFGRLPEELLAEGELLIPLDSNQFELSVTLDQQEFKIQIENEEKSWPLAWENVGVVEDGFLELQNIRNAKSFRVALRCVVTNTGPDHIAISDSSLTHPDNYDDEKEYGRRQTLSADATAIVSATAVLAVVILAVYLAHRTSASGCPCHFVQQQPLGISTDAVINDAARDASILRPAPSPPAFSLMPRVCSERAESHDPLRASRQDSEDFPDVMSRDSLVEHIYESITDAEDSQSDDYANSSYVPKESFVDYDIYENLDNPQKGRSVCNSIYIKFSKD